MHCLEAVSCSVAFAVISSGLCNLGCVNVSAAAQVADISHWAYICSLRPVTNDGKHTLPQDDSHRSMVFKTLLLYCRSKCSSL